MPARSSASRRNLSAPEMEAGGGSRTGASLGKSQYSNAGSCGFEPGLGVRGVFWLNPDGRPLPFELLTCLGN
jgi:hypothetical protein